MTLKGWWGFDSCAVFKYPEWGAVMPVTATGRDGVANHATSMDGNSGGGTLTIPGGAAAGLILGMAWNQASGVFNTGTRVATFRNGANIAAYLAFSATGYLTLYNQAGVVIATAPSSWTLSVWQYLEVKYVPSSSAGVCIVRVNETEVINVSGATTNTGITTIDTIFFDPRLGNVMDDMYLLDLVDETATVGRANNDFLGDVRVAHSYPTSDGTTTSMTPSTGTNHAALVDEVPPNTTDYVSALAGGGTVKDLYQVTDLPAAAVTVFGVRTLLYAAKTDAGAAALKPMIRESTGVETIGAAQNLGVTFTGYAGAFHKVKAAGGEFTPTDINGLQAGAQSG